MASNILDLPRDLLARIAQRVTDIKDFVRARSVCHQLESIFTLENFTPVSQDWLPIFKGRIPHCETSWLMLAEREDSDLRSFFNPATSEVYDIRLPEIWERRIAGSAHGWLVTMGLDMEIHLFNPLTRAQIKLPPRPAFGYVGYEFPEDSPPSYVRDRYLEKVVLSSNPSEKDFMAMAVYGSICMGAVVRPGDKVWTTVGGQNDWKNFQDFIRYKGKIYTVDICGRFGMFDISSEPKSIQLGCLPSLPTHEEWLNRWDRYQKYLVELSGDLLFVGKRMYSAYDNSDLIHDSDGEMLPEVVIPYKTIGFKVYKLDQWQPKVEWVEIKDLGDYSLFVGHNSSFSVKASQPGGWWRRNCIYFTDDSLEYFGEPHQMGGHDQGVYNLEDGSFQLHYEGTSCSFHSPPVWFTPGLR